MRLSIITISLNQVSYIKETIESVINQSCDNIEYIVLDAGSTDGSRDVILQYKDKISKIIFEHDQGQADGLNKAFNYATGDIYGFLNSDDILLPCAISFVINYFKTNLNVDILFGSGYKINKDSKILEKVYPDIYSTTKYIYNSINFIQPSMFFKSECFNKVGGFNINNKTCWDGELVFDMGRNKFKSARTFRFLSAFRIHEASISGKKANMTEYYSDRKRIFEKQKKRKFNKIDHLISYCYRLLNIIQTPQKIFKKLIINNQIFL